MYALQHPERIYCNVGGLQRFLFADADSLLYDPRPRRDLSGSLVVQNIPLAGGAQWQQATVVRYSISYRERLSSPEVMQRVTEDGIFIRILE